MQRLAMFLAVLATLAVALPARAQVEDSLPSGHEGWLEALLVNFDDPMVAVVTGLTLPVELETHAQQWFETTNSFSRGFERRNFDATTMSVLGTGRVGAGVNMAIRRNILKEIGLFDEALDGGTPTLSGGDQEFFYRTLSPWLSDRLRT